MKEKTKFIKKIEWEKYKIELPDLLFLGLYFVIGIVLGIILKNIIFPILGFMFFLIYIVVNKFVLYRRVYYEKL